jgi:signal recognition particle GTPase
MLVMRRLGSLENMVEMLPGMKQLAKNPKALENG